MIDYLSCPFFWGRWIGGSFTCVLVSIEFLGHFPKLARKQYENSIELKRKSRWEERKLLLYIFWLPTERELQVRFEGLTKNGQSVRTLSQIHLPIVTHLIRRITPRQRDRHRGIAAAIPGYPLAQLSVFGSAGLGVELIE